MNIFFWIIPLLLNFTLGKNFAKVEQTSNPIILAYVECEQKSIPDSRYFTHAIYAFGVFSENNDSVIITHPEKLHSMSRIKNDDPTVKIILGLGGYKREGFSEMASDSIKMKSYIESCKRILADYNLDGIDIDWEWPTIESGGHTASANDIENLTLFIKNLRNEIGPDKWISIFTDPGARWMDFDEIKQYIDYFNVGGYNINYPPLHQSPLYPSKKLGSWCVSKSIFTHTRKGITPSKILLGIPFYGRGIEIPRYPYDCKLDSLCREYKLKWDDDAKVPYYCDSNGELKYGFDNERSIIEKCIFVKENNLAGIYYWHYDCDFEDHRLANTIVKYLNRE